MTQLHELSALEQVRMLEQHELSSLELVNHYLARIERANDSLQAFVTVDAEGAREAAARIDDRLLTTSTPDPLFGLPIADKDLVHRAGVATTFGSRAMLGFIPERSDPLVHTLDAAGAVSLGKTNVPEFGLPSYTENMLPGGCARNPWDQGCDPGGSSGGAAVAVAAGLLPVAPGSDGGGSIRIPAAACGLVGIKPSRGRLPDASGIGTLAGLVVAGSIARTVADAALLLDAMIARDGEGNALQQFSVQAPSAPKSFVAALGERPGSSRALRIAWNTWSPWSSMYDVEVDDAALDVLEDVLEVARSLGHEVVEHTPKPAATYPEAFRAVWRAGAAALPLTESQLREVEPLTAWLVRSGRKLSVTELLRALNALSEFERRMIAEYRPYDLVLTPALAMHPRPLGWYDRSDGEHNFAQQCQYTPFTSYVNVVGLPAMTLPTHTNPLPMGVQVIGRPGDELTMLRFGAQLEREFSWGNRRAPGWALGDARK